MGYLDGTDENIIRKRNKVSAGCANVRQDHCDIRVG